MRLQLGLIVGFIAVAGWGAGLSGQDHDKHEAATHTHAAAAQLKNPVKATPASIAAGQKLYDSQCSNCHGVAGKGDGKMAAAITGAKPSDLTDRSWKHGDSDGEIFTLIKDGSKGTGMRGFASRMKTDDIWNVVNYLRTLDLSSHKSH